MIQAVVRVKPLGNDIELEGRATVIGDDSLQLGDASNGRVYQMSRCFDERTSQQLFFDNSGIKKLVDHALGGFAATVFTYGQVRLQYHIKYSLQWCFYRNIALTTIVHSIQYKFIFQTNTQTQTGSGKSHTIFGDDGVSG